MHTNPNKNWIHSQLSFTSGCHSSGLVCSNMDFQPFFFGFGADSSSYIAWNNPVKNSLLSTSSTNNMSFAPHRVILIRRRSCRHITNCWFSNQRTNGTLILYLAILITPHWLNFQSFLYISKLYLCGLAFLESENPNIHFPSAAANEQKILFFLSTLNKFKEKISVPLFLMIRLSYFIF